MFSSLEAAPDAFESGRRGGGGMAGRKSCGIGLEEVEDDEGNAKIARGLVLF